MKKPIYNIIQWTWGLPQTLAGAALYYKHKKDRHFNYNGATATIWDREKGLSLGKFIFVPGKTTSDGRQAVDPFLIDHEYGHSIQSLILGPAYLIVVGMPSLLWNRLPYFDHKRKKSGKSYYSAPFESTANSLGRRHGGGR